MATYRAPNLDSFPWQGTVKDKDLTAPPGSPAKGDRYIVGFGPTGDWAGHAQEITYYSGSAWIFVPLIEGQVCWIDDEDKVYKWNGSAWAELAPLGGGLGYALSLTAANLATLTDGATYYFGNTAALAPQTAQVLCLVYIPKAGTIKSAYIRGYAVTPGSTENVSVYIRKMGADTLVATMPMDQNENVWSNTGLNTAVSAGDYFEIKVVCPTWASNPANVRFSGVIYVE